jgi:hypothetical protein
MHTMHAPFHPPDEAVHVAVHGVVRGPRQRPLLELHPKAAQGHAPAAAAGAGVAPEHVLDAKQRLSIVVVLTVPLLHVMT